MNRYEKLKPELDRLNTAVKDAVKKRTEFLDAHMAECSEWKIGDTVYDVEGNILGIVTKHCRWYQGNAELDDNLDSYVKYETSHNCFDNSSRHMVYTEERVKVHLEYLLGRITRTDAIKEENASI